MGFIQGFTEYVKLVGHTLRQEVAPWRKDGATLVGWLGYRYQAEVKTKPTVPAKTPGKTEIVTEFRKLKLRKKSPIFLNL